MIDAQGKQTSEEAGKEEMMMMTKIYALVWLLVAGTAGLFYFTSTLNEATLTVIGFIFSTLFFGFFVALLPWLMDKQYAWKY